MSCLSMQTIIKYAGQQRCIRHTAAACTLYFCSVMNHLLLAPYIKAPFFHIHLVALRKSLITRTSDYASLIEPTNFL